MCINLCPELLLRGGAEREGIGEVIVQHVHRALYVHSRITLSPLGEPHRDTLPAFERIKGILKLGIRLAVLLGVVIPI